MLEPCIYRGSVKDIYAIDDYYLFNFSDRYSIFDWGEMPDLIKGKGYSLAQMTKQLYQVAQRSGFKHHLLNHKKSQDNQLWVQPCDLSQCWFNESNKAFEYQLPIKKNFARALPLEIVFRFGIESSSSFAQRAREASYLEELGLSNVQAQAVVTELNQLSPVFPIQLPMPVVEFFTKLEPIDRLLNLHEAAIIAHLTPRQLKDLSAHHLQLASIWKQWFLDQGLELVDGKMEWAISYQPHESWILIDSMGPDEMRLKYQGFHLSKELLRQFYRKTPWYQALEKAKQVAQQQKSPQWKSYLSTEALSVPSLDSQWLTFITKMYQKFSELGQQSFELDIKFLKDHLL